MNRQIRYTGMRFFVIIGVILFLSSCKKSENQKATVQLHFQTQAAGADYAFSSYYTNGDGIKLRFEVLQFYVADIRFVNKKGKEVEAAEIALIKCGVDGSGSASVKIPAGDYTAIRFGIGVPQELNEKGPSEFTEPDHPLNSTQNTYWGMNGMYRFVMIDGKYDLTGDGTDEGGFSYHTGFSDCYREVELAHNFSFDRKGDYDLNIGIDVTKLFYVDGSMINVTSESNFHGDYADIDLAIRLSDNFAAALSIH